LKLLTNIENTYPISQEFGTGYQITLIIMLTVDNRKFLIHCLTIQGTFKVRNDKTTKEENVRRIKDFGPRKMKNHPIYVFVQSTKSAKLIWHEPKKSTNNLQ
tara:strand:+ start:151 stop:456 length:306 start_codon:yes stop_codon:yes gene_type:complete